MNASTLTAYVVHQSLFVGSSTLLSDQLCVRARASGQRAVPIATRSPATAQFTPIPFLVRVFHRAVTLDVQTSRNQSL